MHSKLNPSKSFSREEINFLEKHNIIVDLDNCVGKGTFGSLYVALSHQFGYVVLKRYGPYSQASNEAQVLRIFGRERPHPNLTQYHGYLLYRNHLYPLLEYSNVGDLDRFYIDFIAIANHLNQKYLKYSMKYIQESNTCIEMVGRIEILSSRMRSDLEMS
jgi:hypothetical protein